MSRRPSAQLKLEITESVALSHEHAALSTLRELNDLGIRLAIDDFGMGFSVLSYVKRFPVDTLKIDRSFIAGLGIDPESSAIVRAVIDFAKTLSFTVTAEGIERADQLEQLQALGCDRGQGYYFAKPLPGQAVGELLAAAGSTRGAAAGRLCCCSSSQGHRALGRPPPGGRSSRIDRCRPAC